MAFVYAVRQWLNDHQASPTRYLATERSRRGRGYLPGCVTGDLSEDRTPFQLRS